MVVLVRWLEHERQYTIGIQKFLKELGVEVSEERIKQIIKKFLEQQEMSDAE